MQVHLSDSPEIKSLRALLDRALSKAYPTTTLVRYLPPPPDGRIVVVGAGKAGAAMAEAVEDALSSVSESLVVVPYGHKRPCRLINIVEAGHPVPDNPGEKAARKILGIASSLGADDLLVCLLSGGGSALLSLPSTGIILDEKRDLTRELLACGAGIHDINTVRKHLSDIKGGRLAAAAFPARTVTLALSDVPGNDPATIASGPTVGDATSRKDALEILSAYGIKPPPSIKAKLASPTAESPFPSDLKLTASEIVITATAAEALDVAVTFAEEQGLGVVNLGDEVEGIASVLAGEHARAFESERLAHSTGKGFVLISGGEATVALHGDGKGGPNQEYLLALAIELDGRPNVFALAADTDGIDGASEAAGAFITPSTLTRAAAQGLDPQAYLTRNDAGGFFEQLGDLIITGPTCTNVNDFRAIAYIPSRD